MCLQSHHWFFADDTNIFYQGSDTHELQNTVCSDLSKFCDWFSANKLSLNISKTNFVVFGPLSKNWDVTIHLNSIKIDKVNTSKFLGVYIDSHLSWSDHINSISNKISRGVGILSKLKHFIPRTTLRSLIVSNTYFTSFILLLQCLVECN